MIAYLDGILTHKDPTYVIVEVHGVGYQVKISLATFAVVKELDKAKIHTYFHVKEDAHTLYGFADTLEKQLFTDLISVNGVGPSTALVVLSSLSPDELRNAILNEDIRVIQGVKGIGAKTAQRLVLELKDKMKKEQWVADTDKQFSFNKGNSIRQEALSALVTLGFARTAAEKNIDLILKKNQQISIEELIKQALKMA